MIELRNADLLFEELSQIPGVLPRKDEPLARHTPLRIGGPAQLWAVVHDAPALSRVLSAARRARMSWRVCWPMSEWLVRDGGVRGLTIRPGRGFEGITEDNGRFWVGAAALWSSLAAVSAGPVLANLTRWPGSVGSLLERPERERLLGVCTALRWTNGRKVEEIEVVPGEAPPELPKTAVLLSVGLSPEPVYGRGRRRFRPEPTQPAGALFSTTDDAADALLSQSGLVGTRLRSWRLSRTEPGTLVHLGGGTCKDVLLLTAGLAERVEKTRGVTLSPRLPILGTDHHA